MKKIALTSLLLSQLCLTHAAFATAQQAAPADKTPAALDVKVGDIQDNQPIPDKFAYCKPDSKGQTENGANISPAISWQNAPVDTKSFAIIMVDPDVPVTFDNANKPDATIASDAPRQNFYHWTLVDIPPQIHAIDEGAESKGVVPGGKDTGKRAYGVAGKNDYAKMSEGPHGGYDGPCPPWNDTRLHHYHFMVYALDVPSLNLTGTITGPQAEEAMKGHILAKGEVVGTYSDNPAVLAQSKPNAEKNAETAPAR